MKTTRTIIMVHETVVDTVSAFEALEAANLYSDGLISEDEFLVMLGYDIPAHEVKPMVKALDTVKLIEDLTTK